MKNKTIFDIGLYFSFGLLIVATILMRFHTINEPLERDLTTYAVIGHGMLHGKVLYVDIWDHKPPLIYLLYGISDFIFGMNQWSIFIMNILINIATLFAIYIAVKQIGSRVYALWASVAWTLISGTMALQASQPNTEAFLNLCMALLTAFLLSALYQKKSNRFVMWVGLIISAATLIKYIIVVPIFFMILIYTFFEKSLNLKEKIYQLFKILFWTLLPWIIFAIYFGFHHALPEFYTAVIKFNQYYAGVGSGIENSHFIVHTGLSSYIKFLVPSLIAITALLLAMLCSKKYRSAALLSLAWLALTPLTISLPGRDFPHYYQFWLPAYCIALGTSLNFFSLWKKSYSMIIASALACALMITLFLYEYPTYKLPANEWSYREYGSIFIQSKEAGLALGKFLKADESFFEWGDESGLYWYSQINPTTPVLHNSHLQGGPVADSLRRKIVTSMANKPADILVINKNMWPTYQPDPTLQDILKQYAPVSETYSVPGFYILPRLDKTFSNRDLQKDLILPLRINQI